MANSVVGRWPASAMPLVVYAEGFVPDPITGVEIRQLPTWMADFKRTHGGSAARNGWLNGRYDYRFDAVKFAHKVAAMTDLGLSLDDGVLIWLDADTFTHADVTEAWLEGLFPEPSYIAWVDRAAGHPESGFVMFRCSHPFHRNFMESFRDLYTTGDLFRLPGTNDCDALMHVVNVKVAGGKIEPAVSLSGDARSWHHPLIVSRVGECLDHCKGPTRKLTGHSRRTDLKTPRPEPYWRALQ